MEDQIKFYSGKYIACPCGRVTLSENYYIHCYSMIHSDYLFYNKIDKIDLRNNK